MTVPGAESPDGAIAPETRVENVPLGFTRTRTRSGAIIWTLATAPESMAKSTMSCPTVVVVTLPTKLIAASDGTPNDRQSAAIIMIFLGNNKRF